MNTTIFSSAQVKTAVSADVAWQQMKQFGDLSWTVGVDEVALTSDGISQVRKVRVSGNDDRIDERLLSFDERNQTLRYGIDGEGFPELKNYEAQSQVLNRADGCIVRWQCQADAKAEQRADVQTLLDQMAENISRLFAAQFNTDDGEAEYVPA